MGAEDGAAEREDVSKVAAEDGVGEFGIGEPGRRVEMMARSSTMSWKMRLGRRDERWTGWVSSPKHEQMQGSRELLRKAAQRQPIETSRATATQYCSVVSRFRSPLRNTRRMSVST